MRVLMQSGGVRVADSDDPGNYYCEHVFFLAQINSINTVRSNAQGEPLVGFLHIPLVDNRVNTGRVVSQGLRAYAEEAFAQGLDPARILLTGFGPFGDITSNPSGNFVGDRTAIDSALALAFPGQRIVRTTSNGDLTYRIGTRTLVIRPHVLPVDDRAIDNVSPQSLQRQMREFGPHAVLSLGVRSSSTDYGVEHHADDGGMEFSVRPRNVDGRRASISMADNFSLERAFTARGSLSRR